MSHKSRLECQQTVVLSHCSQKEKDGMEDIYLVKNKGHMIRNVQGKYIIWKHILKRITL